MAFVVVVLVVERITYLSRMWLRGSAMTEVQKLLILPSCFKRVTVAQLLLAYEISNILFVTTVKHYFIQKRLPTMHFKEI